MQTPSAPIRNGCRLSVTERGRPRLPGEPAHRDRILSPKSVDRLRSTLFNGRMETTRSKRVNRLTAFTAAQIPLLLLALLQAPMPKAAELASSVQQPEPEPDGKIVWSRSPQGGAEGGASEIFSMNPDGTGRRALTTNRVRDEDPELSPDGSKIVFVRFAGTSADLFVMDSDGTDVVRLTDTPDNELQPTWSPDGKKIAYTSDEGGGSNIFVLADGVVRQLTDEDPIADRFAQTPTWSPDGSQIGYVGTSPSSPSETEIHVVSGTGGTPTAVTSTDPAIVDHFGSLQWSPDGSLFLFHHCDNSLGSCIVYTVGSDGDIAPSTGYSVWRALTPEGAVHTQPSWSPDGSRVSTMPGSGDLNNFDIATMNADGSALTRLFTDENDDLYADWGAFTPSGLVVNSVGDGSDVKPTNGLCSTGATVDGEPECTLRAAIQEANSRPDRDVISFDIRGDERTIRPDEPLPAVDQPVVIDATTQPGFSGTPVVRLVGPGYPNAFRSTCLEDPRRSGIRIKARNSEIRGFVIGGWPCYGVLIGGGDLPGNVVAGNYIGNDVGQSCSLTAKPCELSNETGIGVRSNGNRVGGADPGDRNVIAGNSTGIEILEGHGNSIEGNRIGTDAEGTATASNNHGIQVIGGDDNVIGGPSGIRSSGPCSNTCNVVSGNSGEGISMTGTRRTVVAGNLIGTDATGTVALPNQIGIRLAASVNATVGGSVADGNVISANIKDGLVLEGASSLGPSGGSIIEGNAIGTARDGIAPLGNGETGVVIRSDATRLGGLSAVLDTGVCSAPCNVIANNGKGGVDIVGNPSTLERPNGIVVSGNLITGNGGGIGAESRNSAGALEVGFSENTSIGGTDPTRGNLITDNFTHGVLIWTTNDRTQIAGNSIVGNALMGIELIQPRGPDGDALSGTANSMTFKPPEIFETVESTSEGAPNVTVRGALSGKPNADYRIEAFANATCDPTGAGEGADPVGASSVTTDSSGLATFEVAGARPAGSTFYTATATLLEGSFGPKTSEFSRCMPRHPSTTLTAPSDAGSTTLEVGSTQDFGVGDEIEINPGGPSEERATVVGLGSLLLASPLQFAHSPGEDVVKVAGPPPEKIDPVVSVTVATKRRVVVRIRFDPPYPGARLSVRLQRRASGWKTIATKRATLGFPFGEPAYSGSLVRFAQPPGRGRCRVMAVWRGDAFSERARGTSARFNC